MNHKLFATGVAVVALSFVAYRSKMSTPAPAPAPAAVDAKTQKWIEVSAKKGYEGAGILPFLKTGNRVKFVMGVNKKGEAEYPGGKVEEEDHGLAATIQREVREETGLEISTDRITMSPVATITGGTTGFPAYLCLLRVSEEEVKQFKSQDGTFSKFIVVSDIFDPSGKVMDSVSGNEYEIRKFNRKYVLPQAKTEILKL